MTDERRWHLFTLTQALLAGSVLLLGLAVFFNALTLMQVRALVTPPTQPSILR